MGLDQKMEHVLGRLEIIVPSLEKYQEKVDTLTTQAAVFDTRLTNVEDRVKDLVPTEGEKRSRFWDIVLLVLSNVVGLVFGILSVHYVSKVVKP